MNYHLLNKFVKNDFIAIVVFSHNLILFPSYTKFRFFGKQSKFSTPSFEKSTYSGRDLHL